MKYTVLMTANRAVLADVLRVMGVTECHHAVNFLCRVFQIGYFIATMGERPEFKLFDAVNCEIGDDKEMFKIGCKDKPFRITLSKETRADKPAYFVVQMDSQDNGLLLKCLAALLFDGSNGTIPLIYEHDPGVGRRVFLCDAIARISRNEPL